jgi:Protein of unknown function (DUF3489)
MNVTTAERSKEKPMSTSESESISKPAPEAQPKVRRRPAKKARAPKKAPQVKKAAGKPKSDSSNKKAEVIAMMKRAKGATLAEIIAATSWQAHTVRGFASILGSKGGEKIESSKNAAGERAYKIVK